MVHLKPVEMDNYYDCLELKRDDTKYVGNALDVIAEAYIYRETSRAYAIYNDDTVIGLVIIDEEKDFLKKLSEYGATHHSMLVYDVTAEQMMHFGKLLNMKVYKI